MESRFELPVLKEISRSYENAESQIDTYRKFVIMFFCVGALLVAFGGLSAKYGWLGSIWLVVLGVSGGLSIGFGFYYSMAMQNLPIMNKFLVPDLVAIANRIEELEKK